MSTANVITAHHSWALSKLQALASDKAIILSHRNWAETKLVAIEQDHMVAQSHLQWANAQRAMAASEEERLRRLSVRTTLNARIAAQLQRVHEEVLALATGKPTPRPATNPMKAALINHETVVSNKELVMEELERTAHRRANCALAQQEQQERVVAMKMDHVLENLVRSVNSKRAILQFNIERIRRCDATQDLVRDENLLEAFNATLECIPRKATVDTVIMATLQEQAHRVQKNLARNVISELEKKSNQRKAKEAMDNERTRRITVANMQPVLEQFTRKNNSLVAAFLCDQEQIRRVQERAFFRPVALPPTLLSDISRVATLKAVREATANEKAYRVQADRGRNVFASVARVVAQRTAVRVMEAERVCRIARANFSTYVLPDLQRRGAIKFVTAAVEEERARRMALDRASWTPGPKKTLSRRATQWAIVLSDVRRAGEQRVALKEMALEAERRVQAAYFKNRVLVELIDQATRHALNAAVAVEQAQQITRAYLLNTVHPEYFQALRTSFAVGVAEEERDRRIAEPVPTPSSGLLSVHESLVRAHNAKETLQQMEDERARRVLVDQYQPVLESIVRAHAQRQVMEEVSIEQARRITTALFQGVVTEITRMARAAEADFAMDAEQWRRISEPGYRASHPLPHPSHFLAFAPAGSFLGCSHLVETSH